MKAFYALLTCILLLVVMSPTVSSQEKKETKTEPAHKMVEFHMALLKRGPKWTATESADHQTFAGSARAEGVLP